ncbi:MAG: hypothetical protein JF614_01835 [Acidobacteria bacterium]|nr:hypothetical protein [Acidobacteriota bacterium]
MENVATTSRNLSKALVLAGLLLLPAAAAADEGARFVGLWKGAIIFEKGATEGDMVLDLMPDADGKLLGLCSLPIHGVADHPLIDVKAAGSQLTFIYRDDKGSSQVTVSLSPDGKHLNGSMQEGDKTYPLFFKKTSREDLAPQGTLQVLSADNRELRQRFDQDAGKVRLLVLLSPTCAGCTRMARMIQRYLLEEVNDPRLAVYLVWGPMQETDNPEVAKQMLVHVTDRRAVHFWMPNTDLTKQFNQPLSTELAAWDVIFFFGPQARWTLPPKPADYAHQWGTKLPQDHLFNGEKLAAQVQKLLPARQALQQGSK